MLQHCYNNVTKIKNRKSWKCQYHNAGCIINAEIPSPLRAEPPISMPRPVMDFSGAESNLEGERGIGTQQNNRKVPYTQSSVIDWFRKQKK